jgi:NDP-sugar pyrophosphorylase family protein
MRAVILAGGEGTRLRPLTLSTPKPVVPVVDRPFLRHQLDLLAGVGIREVIFSVAYRPERVEAVFGDGSSLGLRIRYAVEETPLGRGAVRNALPSGRAHGRDERRRLTDVDLAAVVARHEQAGSASILLTPVPNPAAYGLVETDGALRVLRFLEKPRPEQVTTHNINAGIYVLETRTLELMPEGVNRSIERAFFPDLIARGDRVLGPVHRGYWIDIGTPEKYLQVHRDIMDGRYTLPPFKGNPEMAWVAPSARIEPGARLQGPLFIDEGCVVKTGATIGPHTVLGKNCHVDENAVVSSSIVWPDTHIGREAQVSDTIVGESAQIGRNASVQHGVLGNRTHIAEYSRL